MASTISAGTTSGTAIAITGDTTGNLAFTTQAGTNTITVPNSTGTILTTGSPQSGGVIQVVNATSNTQYSTSSTSYVSTGFTATITPKFTTSKILVIYGCGGLESSGSGATLKGSIQIWRGGSSVFQVSTNILYNTSAGAGPACSFLDSPATTSAITYTLYILSGTSTFYIGTNGSSNSFTLMEIAG